MNLSQLHERLRIEINRRIDRGLLTGTSLAAQTGLKSSHISNFLRRRRNLSMTAFDRVLAAQSLTVEDLVPPSFGDRLSRTATLKDGAFDLIPVVSHAAAIHSPAITQAVTLEFIRVPSGILDTFRSRRTLARRHWQRFVAVRVSSDQASPMSPVLFPQSIALLDRHYSSLIPYQPPQPNVYGVNSSNTLVFRYVSFVSKCIVLRPYSLQYPVELLEIGEDVSPSSYIVGRVCIAISML